MSPLAKFAALRARYTAQVERRERVCSAFSLKYGSGWNEAWISRGEAKSLAAARAGVDKSEKAFSAHLTAISPRDWSYGVPCHWLYEKLTYEDATRPIGEALSVTPPLSYGATEART